MLSGICETLNDLKGTKEEIQYQQKKIWHASAKSLNDPSLSFVTQNLEAGAFSQILYESNLVKLSIQSTIFHYPLPECVIFLEQILSLLNEIPISTVINLLEGLSFISLPNEERIIIATLLDSYTDINNFNDYYQTPPSSPAPILSRKQTSNNNEDKFDIDWSHVSLTNFPIDDEELKQQLEETEKSALLLRQFEQDRKRSKPATKKESPAASLSKIPIGNIFAFMNNTRESYKQELEEMERNKTLYEENQNEILKDDQQINLEKCLENLKKEKENLLDQIQTNEKQLENISGDLARYVKESSIEQQRYLDELEGLDSNIELKEKSLLITEQTIEKFNEFFDGPFAKNNSRLMDTKESIINNILSSTIESPLLIYRYLDSNIHLLNELRRKLKRVRKDRKRIARAYGDDAAAAIQIEYKKLKEIFFDNCQELEEAMAIYNPILQPVLEFVLNFFFLFLFY